MAESRLVPQCVVHKHQRSHRLHNRHPPRQHTRILPPPRFQYHILEFDTSALPLPRPIPSQMPASVARAARMLTNIPISFPPALGSGTRTIFASISFAFTVSTSTCAEILCTGFTEGRISAQVEVETVKAKEIEANI